jgi:hypothetical protein
MKEKIDLNVSACEKIPKKELSSGFPFQGTRHPMWVRVPRNPGTHSYFSQNERKYISECLSMLENIQK